MIELTLNNITKKKVKKICEEALQNLDAEIEVISNTEIVGHIKASFLSFGEKITINIESTNQKSHNISILSEPKAVIQLISWGKHSENENNVFDNIQKLATK